MKKIRFERKTAETDLKILLGIEGSGKTDVRSGIPFFDHMLKAFALHGRFDLEVTMLGDTEVDLHHSLEDLGIGLGSAFKESLGDKKGIRRAGFFIFPMDEALATVAIDLSGRPFLQFSCPMAQPMLGTFPTDLIQDFFQGLTSALGAALHIRVENGRSSHHQIEAIFKAFGRALAQACARDPRAAKTIPSTKGIL